MGNIKIPLNYKCKKIISIPSITQKTIKYTDFKDFCSHLKIRSGNKLVNFNLYDYQILLANLIESYKQILVVKSRQLGFTQFFGAYFLYKALHNPAYNAVILSKTQQDTSLIAFRIKEMLLSLGNVTLRNDNLVTIRIQNGGNIYFKNSKPDATRGMDSVSDILIDECSFIDNIEDIYTSVIPCMEMVENPHLVLLSTPNGQGNFYYDKANSDNPENYDLTSICQAIRNKEVNPTQYWKDNTGWLKFITHWRAHPKYGRNNNYIQEISKNKKLPLNKVLQEYDLSFLSSDIVVFSYDLIESVCILEKNTKVNDNTNYYMSIDPASMGDDFFVITIISEFNNSFKLVEYYREQKKNFREYIRRISNYITKYNIKKIAIETNNIGAVYFQEISNIFCDVFITNIVTNNTNKIKMITELVLLLERRHLLLLKDKVLKDELKSFQNKNGTYKAIQGKHDDIILSLAFHTKILPNIDDCIKKNTKINSF
jgi:hypothetical protein